MTYHYDKDGLQKRANEDKHASTKDDRRGNLFCQLQLRVLKRRDGYYDEVDVGEYAGNEGDLFCSNVRHGCALSVDYF